MTKQVRIIMGANYGDEGKGLLVDYFVKSALVMVDHREDIPSFPMAYGMCFIILALEHWQGLQLI